MLAVMAGNRDHGLPEVFVGSEAASAGLVSPSQLRGPAVQRLLQGVYAPSVVPVTHRLRCAGAALALPPAAVITGRSAATISGVKLAGALDPVEVIAPRDIRVTRRRGIDLRRCRIEDDEWSSWRCGRLATPLRMTLDLLLDRSIPDAVADLDAVLRAGLVQLGDVRPLVGQRSDRGIVRARRAVDLADPRAESRPESKVRVYLMMDGLDPVPQFWITNDRGRIARTDLAFPAQRVAVEYDGAWRDGQLWALNRDRERLNQVQAAGWVVVFVTAPMLREPDRIVRIVREALARAH